MKAKFFILLSMSIIILLTFVGCNNNEAGISEHTDEAAIGIIETTGYKDKSYIHFYDENLNFLYKEENNYANLSESWDDPIFCNRNMYSIPRGMFQKQNESCIIEYSIDTDEYNEYQNGLVSMNELAVSKDYMFGVNTINGVTTIARNTIGDVKSEPLKKEFSDEYIFEMKVMDENLYCFSTLLKDDSIHFKCLSIEDLSIIYDYEITEYGSPAEMLKMENLIYFTNQYINDVETIPGKMLTVFNEKDKSFSQIELSEESPNDILTHNDLLIISHYDRVQAVGNKITIYNLADKKIEKTIELNHDAVQCIIKDEYLYVLGHDCISKYLIENNDCKEIANTKVDMQNGSTFFYLSSVFKCD